MGETLELIAQSLAKTVPRGGTLITAEDRPQLRAILAARAADRGSRIVYADPASVTDEEMRGFDYLQFKENVAVGVAIAQELGISRKVAIRGMWKSVPDVGVVRLHTYDIRGKRVIWVPMFAANDRESVVRSLQTLSAQFPPDSTVIGILNNRSDRGRRAELFAEMATSDLQPFFDHYLLFGAYEETVFDTIVAAGRPPQTVHRLGNQTKPSLDEILDSIAALIPGDNAVLIGLVNIHTEQAEHLMRYFAERDGWDAVDELAESRNARRQPRGYQRARRVKLARLTQPSAGLRVVHPALNDRASSAER
jgi:poly-gamma-glutamate synthase PgsB/CapB